MTSFRAANLISVFDFYLAAMFVIGLYRRRHVYWDTLALIISIFGRQRLLKRVTQHKDAFLTSQVLRPVLLALALMAIQFLCSRVIFPDATLSVQTILDSWWRSLVILVSFVPMFCLDVYFLVKIGRFDRFETEKYLDMAENWLGWRSSTVRVLTLGIVNPKKKVDAEVRKGLEQLGLTVIWSMWWVSAQVTLRVIFGLTIWTLWATYFV